MLDTSKSIFKSNLPELVSGFSQFSRDKKIDYLINHFTHQTVDQSLLHSFLHNDKLVQQKFDEFSENTITNFHLPFGVVPNLLLNGKLLTVPLVTEESSVVAAASSAAKFWAKHGGVTATVIDDEKIGNIHFFYLNDFSALAQDFEMRTKALCLSETASLCENMRQRGGGIRSLELINQTSALTNLAKLKVTFNTCDAMGANFINTVLEYMSQLLKREWPQIDINMSILSNYTPNCRVEAIVSAPLNSLTTPLMEGALFARRIVQATEIARVDPSRATTHNKGIMNGIDAVIMALGNDYRAVEACAHAYAARDGQYRGLTTANIDNDRLIFKLEIPLSIGTVGGMTSLHPLVEFSFRLLNKPSAHDAMKIAASIGLLQNFAALRSLVTTGIQKGHMKLHLGNLLATLGATTSETHEAKRYFKDKTVSKMAVTHFLSQMRNTL